MDGFIQNVSKYITENPKFIMVLIIVLLILVVWFYLKSRNAISHFSSKKNKLKKTKTKSTYQDSDDEMEEPIREKTNPVYKKNTSDPAIAQLVKDINQNT